jgi:soluble lytic murein transglycosylase
LNAAGGGGSDYPQPSNLPKYKTDYSKLTTLELFYKGYYDKVMKRLPKDKYLNSFQKASIEAEIHWINGRYDAYRSLILPLNVSQKWQVPYLAFLKSRIYLKDGDIDQVVNTIRSVQSIEQGPFVAKLIRLEMAEHFVRLGEFSKASEQTSILLKNRKDPVIYPEVLRLRVLVEIFKKRQAQTLERYGDLISQYPHYDRSGALFAVIKESFSNYLKVEDTLSSERSHFMYLENLYELHDYEQVIKTAEYFANHFPESRKLYRSYIFAGLAHYRLGHYTRAVDKFKRSLSFTSYRYQEIEPRYYLYRSQERTKDFQGALKGYLALMKDDKRQQFEERVIYYALRLLKAGGDNAIYQSTLNRFKRGYLGNYLYRRFMWEDEWSKLYLRTYAVKQQFSKAVGSSSLERRLVSWFSSFFHSKYEQFSRYQFIRKGVDMFPQTFFSNQIMTNILAPTDRYTAPVQLNFKSRNITKRFNWLYTIGHAGLAYKEVAHNLNGLSKDDREFFDYVYSNAQLNKRFKDYAAIETALRRSFGDEMYDSGEIPKPFLTLLYPKLYWSEITQYSKKYNVDPFLILAIIREESMFDPLKLDPTKKKGLMQLSPTLARDLAYRIGLRYTGETMLYTPRLNIRLGTFYVSRLSTLFDGNVAHTVSAFDAGMGNTRSWVTSKNKGNTVDFIKTVPFPGTQDYIQRVLDSYMIYTVLYGS